MSFSVFQKNFARALLERNARFVVEDILEDGLPPQERFEIYQNNTFITLTQALAQNFPVTCRLVGQNFFDQMARSYIRVRPPKSPVLMTYGAHMPEFIERYAPAETLPYLPDVARFETLWNKCFNGKDSHCLDVKRLNDLEPTQFENLIFGFQKNMELFKTPYPILAIWLANQDAEAAQDLVSLDQGGDDLVLFRIGLEVEIMRLDAAGYEFLKKLKAGTSLGQAAMAVKDRYADFVTQDALQAILQAGLINDFSLA